MYFLSPTARSYIITYEGTMRIIQYSKQLLLYLR